MGEEFEMVHEEQYHLIILNTMYLSLLYHYCILISVVIPSLLFTLYLEDSSVIVQCICVTLWQVLTHCPSIIPFCVPCMKLKGFIIIIMKTVCKWV